jgi:glycyl-tRNA synthetase
VVSLVGPLADAMGFDAAAKDVATEAARLAKADLATSTVMEMTALAGTMGRWVMRAAAGRGARGARGAGL